MAGAKIVLAALDEGEGSASRSCWRWTFGAGRRGVNGVGAADGTENGTLDERKGTENGTLDERKGKDVVGVEGKDAGSNDDEK